MSNYFLIHISPQTVVDKFTAEALFYSSSLKSNWILIIAFIGNVIFLPLGYELLFRGLIQRGLKTKFGLVKISILQTLLFTLSYVNYWTFAMAYGTPGFVKFVYIILIGFLFTILREEEGLECSVSAHVCMNLFGFVLMFL